MNKKISYMAETLLAHAQKNASSHFNYKSRFGRTLPAEEQGELLDGFEREKIISILKRPDKVPEAPDTDHHLIWELQIVDEGALKNKVYQKRVDELAQKEEGGVAAIPENFFVKIKDREVRVNSYLLRKPYAVGKNMTFLEYINERSGQLLTRSEMPEHIKKEMGKRTFGKILNALGFTGKMLSAFAPKRSKSSVLFRNEVTKSQLEREGVDVELMIKELELAHRRNSPK